MSNRRTTGRTYHGTFYRSRRARRRTGRLVAHHSADDHRARRLKIAHVEAPPVRQRLRRPQRREAVCDRLTHRIRPAHSEGALVDTRKHQTRAVFADRARANRDRLVVQPVVSQKPGDGRPRRGRKPQTRDLAPRGLLQVVHPWSREVVAPHLTHHGQTGRDLPRLDQRAIHRRIEHASGGHVESVPRQPTEVPALAADGGRSGLICLLPCEQWSIDGHGMITRVPHRHRCRSWSAEIHYGQEYISAPIGRADDRSADYRHPGCVTRGARDGRTGRTEIGSPAARP